MAVLKQESQTMGPQVALFQREFAKAFHVNHAFTLQLYYSHACCHASLRDQ
jgi:dTDP-4-amino-4,6-dideoxygalactose transaminase